MFEEYLQKIRDTFDWGWVTSGKEIVHFLGHGHRILAGVKESRGVFDSYFFSIQSTEEDECLGVGYGLDPQAAFDNMILDLQREARRRTGAATLAQMALEHG